MKYLCLLCFTLISFVGLSQEVIIEEDNTPSKLMLAVNYPSFEDIYNRLDAITENINDTSITLQRIDEIRQGILIIDTKRIGHSFEGLKIEARPSLNLELQRVMFTGNFFNTLQRTPLIIRQ